MLNPLCRDISLHRPRAQLIRKLCQISTVSAHNYNGQNVQSGSAYSEELSDFLQEREENMLEFQNKTLGYRNGELIKAFYI